MLRNKGKLTCETKLSQNRLVAKTSQRVEGVCCLYLSAAIYFSLLSGCVVKTCLQHFIIRDNVKLVICDIHCTAA